MTAHASILAWEISRTEEPAGYNPCPFTSVVSDSYDIMDCGPPGSSVCGILQARILECIAMSSSRATFWLRNQTSISCDFCIAGGFFTGDPPGKPREVNTASDCE